jgi:tetratricopeptide (TPR) repeat protein
LSSRPAHLDQGHIFGECNGIFETALAQRKLVDSARKSTTNGRTLNQQGLEIREKLAARDPANTEWQRDLSVSYGKIGDVQSAQGELSSALSSYNKTLGIEKQLGARDPADTEWQRDLSVSYDRIATCSAPKGDLPSALSSYQQGLEIAQKLATPPTRSGRVTLCFRSGNSRASLSTRAPRRNAKPASTTSEH